MLKTNKMLLIGLVLLFIISCAAKAYAPIGMISRVEPGTYTTVVYGASEKDATSKANIDAKGICMDKHQEEYFSIVSTVNEDLNIKSEDKGSGVAGALSGMMKMSQNAGKENNKVSLTFKCG